MKIISMLNLSIALGFAFMMIVFGYRFIRGKRISISDMFYLCSWNECSFYYITNSV